MYSIMLFDMIQFQCRTVFTKNRSFVRHISKKCHYDSEGEEV